MGVFSVGFLCLLAALAVSSVVATGNAVATTTTTTTRSTALVVATVDPTRKRLIDCMLRYVDVMPQDGFITSEEIEHAKQTILTSLQRSASFVVPTPTIMNDCDFDRDGKISRRDMELSTGSCLNAGWKIAMADKYICKQAAQRAGGNIH